MFCFLDKHVFILDHYVERPVFHNVSRCIEIALHYRSCTTTGG